MIDKSVYQHYKGNYYEVLDIATHTETLESMVVYRALYGDHGLWVRPASMFEEKVMVDNKEVPRFKRVAEAHKNLEDNYWHSEAKKGKDSGFSNELKAKGVKNPL